MILTVNEKEIKQLKNNWIQKLTNEILFPILFINDNSKDDCWEKTTQQLKEKIKEIRTFINVWSLEEWNLESLCYSYFDCIITSLDWFESIIKEDETNKVYCVDFSKEYTESYHKLCNDKKSLFPKIIYQKAYIELELIIKDAYPTKATELDKYEKECMMTYEFMLESATPYISFSQHYEKKTLKKYLYYEGTGYFHYGYQKFPINKKEMVYLFTCLEFNNIIPKKIPISISISKNISDEMLSNYMVPFQWRILEKDLFKIKEKKEFIICNCKNSKDSKINSYLVHASLINISKFLHFMKDNYKIITGYYLNGEDAFSYTNEEEDCIEFFVKEMKNLELEFRALNRNYVPDELDIHFKEI